MNSLIGILGGAESGVGAAVLAKVKGYRVWLSDKGRIRDQYKQVLKHYGVDFEEGGHRGSLLLQADVVVKSPGIPDRVDIVQQLRKNGIPVISDIEWADRFTSAKTIAITGSNGKTTTTKLIGYILQSAGANVVVAGNIGESYAKVLAGREPEIAVIEISSFQLDGIQRFKPHIAILTTITPDHLDRYNNNFQHYVDAKLRIIQNQTPADYLIYNADDPVIITELKKRNPKMQLLPFSLKNKKYEQGAFINEHNEVVINIKNSNITMTLEELALQGKHNTYNSMAGGIASKLLEIRKDTIQKCLSDFQNVEHRLEQVGTVHGIHFINDSKATNVNSTWYALESMTGQVIWIAGGIDKGNDYDMLKDLVKEKVKGIVCMGLNNEKIWNAFGNEVKSMVDAYSAGQAVQAAYSMAKPGDTILLSPACASFDLFENFEDRGIQFKKAVREL
ncbi:MAG: UDP-N-acetylmuramoyl-L-alanine--D-glutamate ligase [Bacteroidales bacterium]